MKYKSKKKEDQLKQFYISRLLHGWEDKSVT